MSSASELPAPSGSEPQAPVPSAPESQAPTLSQWLQLMLAEIAAGREALEGARAEEARRRAEREAVGR